MARQFQLQAVSTPQIIPLTGGIIGFHYLRLQFGTYPSSGTVKLEYRRLGEDRWIPSNSIQAAPLSDGLDISLTGSISSMRITFSGLVGGVSPILWLETTAFSTDAYLGRQALTTQPYTEANVKNGVQYYLRAAWPSDDPINVGAENARRIWFKTGPLPVIVKLRDFLFVAEEMSLTIFRGPTGVSGGQDLQIHNYNGITPVPAEGVQAKKNVTTVSDGVQTESNDIEYFFGASSSVNRVLSSIPEGREKILPPNTEFIVLITNLSGGGGAAARAQYFLDFYVGKTDTPL